MTVKPLAFFGVGVGVHLEGGAIWPFCAAFLAAVMGWVEIGFLRAV